MTNLPQEILEQIFGYLKVCDQTQCQLVCSFWKKVAQRAIYKDIEVYSSEQMDLLIDALSESPSDIGQLVCKISILYIYEDNYIDGLSDEDDYYMAEVISKLAKYTPRLRCIRMEVTSIFFWEMLMEQWKMGHWKNLIELPYPQNDHEVAYYFEAITTMHDKVNDIMLCDYFVPKLGNHKERYDKMVSRLSLFENVEKLIYQRYESSGLNELDKIINQLPSLKKLSLRLFSPDQISVQFDHDVLHNKPNTKIQVLNVSTALGSGAIFDYIVHKYPSLKELQISCTEKCEYISQYEEIQPSLSEASVQKAITFLSKLENFNIRDTNFKNLDSLLIGLQKSLTQGTFEVQFRADYQLGSAITLKELHMVYSKSGRRHNSHVQMSAAFESKFISQFSEKAKRISQIVTDLTIFSMGPESLAPLRVRNEDVKPETAPKCYLKQICILCPKLKILQLTATNLLEQEIESDLQSPLQMLTLRRCAFAPIALQRIIEQFPKLRMLGIAYPRLIEASSGLVRKKNTNLMFDLSGAILHLLGIEGIWFQGISKFFFKVSDERATKYFTIDSPRSLPATQDQFQDAVDNPAQMTVTVQCKEIHFILMDDTGCGLRAFIDTT
ncbi:hypothetical protein EDC96DRAFT_492334 [Choanephora cucurbitarum]|nr:hypothetical protein EDC96DRAFT_492334 [Choanephora cucurbitarum]